MNIKSSKCYQFLSRNGLIVSVLVGVAVGFALGFGLREVEPSDDAITWIGLPGEIYMRLLKMLLLPLVVATIITGTASMDPKSNGRISAVSFGYILASVAIGAIIAIILFFIFQPGKDTEISAAAVEYSNSVKRNIRTSDMFADMIRNFFPDNIVTVCFQKSQTKYSMSTRMVALNGTNNSITDVHKIVSSTGSLNILGLIVVCLLFGITASNLGERVELFIKFFEAISLMVLYMMNWVIWLTPIGVASLIATGILKAYDIETVFSSLGIFVLAHSIGIIFHQLVLIPVIYFIVTRKNPLIFMGFCLRPCLSVFGPPSTAVGIPDMLKTLGENLHVDSRVSNFFVPVAASLARCGSCIFICLSSLFLTQLEGMSLDASKVLIIGLLSTAGALAVPPVPSASIVSILVVLTSVDIEVNNVGLLIALEWYNDRIRTTSNATTIILGALVVEKLCRWDLKIAEDQNLTEKPIHESEVRVLVESEK